MFLRYGAPYVIDCVFKNTWYVAIYDSFSDPVMENIEFVDNGKDMDVEVAETDLDLWEAVITLYLFPVMFLIFKCVELVHERYRLRKEAKEQFGTLDVG